MTVVGTAEAVVAFGIPESDALGSVFADPTTRSQVEATMVRLVGDAKGELVWLTLLVAKTMMTHAAPVLHAQRAVHIEQMAAWDYALSHPVGKDEAAKAITLQLAKRRVRAMFPGFLEMVQQLPGHNELIRLFSDLVRDGILQVMMYPDALGRHRQWTTLGPYYASYVTPGDINPG